MELTLLDQITNAVRERVHPFRVEAREVGDAIHVKIEGINKEWGYRAITADGTPNGHTPESFADSLAYLARNEISAILLASEKRDRKAAKRLGVALCASVIEKHGFETVQQKFERSQRDSRDTPNADTNEVTP